MSWDLVPVTHCPRAGSFEWGAPESKRDYLPRLSMSLWTFHCSSGPAPFPGDLLHAGNVVEFPGSSAPDVSVIWYGVSPARTHTQDTHGFFCSIALMHLERKIISFWGRRLRTQETRSLNRPQEGLETYFTLTDCSLSAQMTPDDARWCHGTGRAQGMEKYPSTYADYLFTS